jgi:hypothetical protein
MKDRSVKSARNLVKLGLLSASFFWSVSMSASSEKPFPSVVVEEAEVRLAPGSAFAAACSAKAHKLATMNHWKLRETMLTFNKHWGLIWRGDFTDSGGDLQPLINRVICWRLPRDSEIQITVAFGQDTPPLGNYIRKN